MITIEVFKDGKVAAWGDIIPGQVIDLRLPETRWVITRLGSGYVVAKDEERTEVL